MTLVVIRLFLCLSLLEIQRRQAGWARRSAGGTSVFRCSGGLHDSQELAGVGVPVSPRILISRVALIAEAFVLTAL